METLKQALGFVLFATVLWLAWVLSLQTGPTAPVILLGALLILGVAAWVLGRWGRLDASRASRVAAYTTATVLILGGVVLGVAGADPDGPAVTQTHSGDGIKWESFSPERLAQLRGDGRPVFIDFTAAWCLSCQVNKRVALETADVAKRFVELGVATLEADWTMRDEMIARALAEYGRNSVPLYVLYLPGSDTEPIFLPQILTPGIVLDALNKIRKS